MRVPLIRLECGCNSYEWGKVGSSSPAAKFAAATNFEIDENKPYAELWMGTHPSLPSKELDTQRSLLELLQENQALVSEDIARRFGPKLPFLFKILSITKALSIQAHPNKKLAEQLHQKDPANYKDDNHKPEMTIALNHCDGLCGFRPLAEISHFLQTVKPLRDLVGESTASGFVEVVSGNEDSTDPTQAEKNKGALQDAFTKLMQTATSSSEALKTSAEALVEEAQNAPSSFAGGGGPSPTSGTDLAKLILRLNDQFPNDVGLFVLFFCNYVQLEPGEAMFLRADDIHAYLSGDMVECMAESDNVVRAGFTPKFKDVDTLTNMLTYSYAPIAEQKMDPKDYMFVRLDRVAYSAGSSCILYDPPIEEFSVVRTEIKAKEGKASFEPIDGPSVVICTQGDGTISVGETTHDIKTGYVYFVGATASLVLRSTSDDIFVTFKAFCELPQSNGDHGDTNGRL